tara:strand:+ start:2520 stop:3128 length:609 start_codon:yes stop_codon:yes gene_type:complete
MKLDVKSLLKDKNVLYVVLFLAVMNLFGYLMLRDLDAVFFFLALGLVTSYFSKNMIIVMIVAMIGTNLLMSTRRPTKEGFEGEDGTKKAEGGKHKGSASDTVSPASAEEDEEEATGKKPNIDYASTLEKAYDNLDKLLGSDALKHMSDRTQNLAAQQANLMETMKGMEPMMQRAGQMLEGLDVGQMGGMIEGLTKKLEGLKM